MPRWGMVIDLSKCNGCGCCVINCSQSNGFPEGFSWRQVPWAEASTEEMPRRLYLSMSCMHCAQPPCLEVCPTEATFQRPDGIVDIRAEQCMGCGYCVVACPYLARTVLEAKVLEILGIESPLGPEEGPERSPAGVCTKCDFCAPRLEAGLEKGLTPGVDPEASPVCMNTCQGKAIQFGDLEDPESTVSRLLAERKASRVNEELGTEPAVYYLPDR